MDIIEIKNEDLNAIKAIYLEAFPKRERKPFCSLKRSINKGKARVFVAKDNEELCGFIITFPYKNMVLVDYLAVSSKIRSKGTGSLLLKETIKRYQDKIIVLLIEKIDHKSPNYSERVSRKNFYLKNGFTSSNLYIDGKGGQMEILNYGGSVDKTEFLNIMEYTLGKIFFKLSKFNFIK